MPEDYGEPSAAIAPQMPMLTSDRSFLAAQTDPSKLLEDIAHWLKGEVKNLKTGEWSQILNKPLANEDGIGLILLRINTLVTQNTILSSLSEKDVSRFMLSLATEVQLFLAQNYKRFEIAESNLTTVKNIILDPIWFSLKRALNEGERRFLTKTLSEHHTQTISASQKKPNYLKGIVEGMR